MLFFGLDPIVADSLGTQFTLVLLCGFLFRLSFRSRPGSSRRELPRGPVPVVDARLFATPQHAADDVGDAFGAGPPSPPAFFPPSRSRSTCRNHKASNDSVMWWCQPTQLRTS